MWGRASAPQSSNSRIPPGEERPLAVRHLTVGFAKQTIEAIQPPNRVKETAMSEHEHEQGSEEAAEDEETPDDPEAIDEEGKEPEGDPLSGY